MRAVENRGTVRGDDESTLASTSSATRFTYSASAVGHGVEASSPSLIECEDKGKIGTLSGAEM